MSCFIFQIQLSSTQTDVLWDQSLVRWAQSSATKSKRDNGHEKINSVSVPCACRTSCFVKWVCPCSYTYTYSAYFYICSNEYANTNKNVYCSNYCHANIYSIINARVYYYTY